VSRLSDTALEIAVVSLTYTAAELRKQHAITGIDDLRKAAEAQDAARKEIREFIDSPEHA
jgi:hypothetical protein